MRSVSQTKRPLWRGPLSLLLVALVTVGIGRSVLIVILQPLGREVGLTPFEVGVVIGASALVFSFASPFWGRKAESWGRLPVIVFGLISYGLTTILFAAVLSLGLNGSLTGFALLAAMLFLRVLFALTASGVFPASVAYIADVTTPVERTAGVALIGAAFGIGSLVGPGFGGLLSVFGALVPLFAASAISVCAAITLWFFLPQKHMQIEKKVGAKLRFCDPRILPYLPMGFAMAAMIASIQHTISLRFMDLLGLSLVETIQITGSGLILMAGASLFVQGVLVQRFNWPPKPLLRFGYPVGALSFLGLLISESSATLMLSMVLFGLSYGCVNPGNAASISLRVDAGEQGSAAGLDGTGKSLGFFVGTLLSTALYQFNPDLPFWTGLCVMLMLAVYVSWLFIPDPNASVNVSEAPVDVRS